LSTDCRPNSVFETIGKRAIRMQTMTRAEKSKPNQNPMSGTRARIGMHCRMTAYGKSERSIQRAWLMATAQTKPMTIAIARPVSATPAERASASMMSPTVFGSKNASVKILCGGGTRNDCFGSMTT
jgi:hypothetical protein